MKAQTDTAEILAIEMRQVTKRFGDILANDRVSLAIRAGSIHGIVGENGAGKSTAMKIVYGLHAADSGRILIGGREVVVRNPADAIAAGVGMVHQHFMLIENLTVAENVVLGCEPVRGIALDYAAAVAQVREISERYGLRIDPAARVQRLSVGEQQRVEILKMLYRRATVLILDEPTAVLSPNEVRGLFSVLRSLRDKGNTIIIITHKLSEVLVLCDDVTVMRGGRVAGTTPTSETTAEALARMIVGSEPVLEVQKQDASRGPRVLEVRAVSCHGPLNRPKLRDISFEIRRGEILAIAGVEGSGQTELIEVLAGLRAPSAGEVVLDGRSLAGCGVMARRKRGIAHIPEDRLRRGLLPGFSMKENSILGVHGESPITGHLLFDLSAIDLRARRLAEQYDIRPRKIDLPARAFSGGNQQKLVVAREFDRVPKLVLAAQPTRGVDIGATAFIHRKLLELRDRGAAVLLISADLDELLALGDRLLVLFGGRIVGEVAPGAGDQEKIGMMMTGAHFSGAGPRTSDQVAADR